MDLSDLQRWLSELPSWLFVAVLAAYIAMVLTALIFAILSRNWSFFQSLLWVVVVLAVPLLGSVLFFVVDAKFSRERRTLHEVEAERDTERDAEADAPAG
ncbi:hypothetical protein [Flindersiella endophytica]